MYKVFVILLFPIFSFAGQKTSNCIVSKENLSNSNGVVTSESISKAYKRCLPTEKRVFVKNILSSSFITMDDAYYKELKLFIDRELGRDSLIAMKLWKKFSGNGETEPMEDYIREIVEYAPEIFETKIYDFDEKQIIEFAEKVVDTSNIENSKYVLSLLLARSLDTSESTINELLALGASFTYNLKTKENLCDFVDEKFVDMEVHLADDFFGQTSSEVREAVIEEVTNYFNLIESSTNLRSIICGDKTLYEFKLDLLNPDFWSFDDYFDEDQGDEPFLELFKMKAAQLKSNKIVSVNRFNFYVDLEASESCYTDVSNRDILESKIYNQLLGSTKRYPNHYSVEFIFSERFRSCKYLLEYRFIDHKGVSVDKFIDENI
jgi:hypothetical protein